MTTYKDTDLREALRRKYADTPQLPADFIQRMQKSAPRPASPRGGEPRQTLPIGGDGVGLYIAALAAAACIVLAVLMVWPTSDGPESDGSELLVRHERTASPTGTDHQPDTTGLAASTKETIKQVDSESRVLPVKAAVHQAKKTDRQLVELANTASASDSLDYYINKIERELASVDDSLYIERIHRVMHADERLQRIVNNYILNELRKDAQPHQAAIINNVTTDEDEE